MSYLAIELGISHASLEKKRTRGRIPEVQLNEI